MGKARSFSNESTETVYQTESNNENFALGSQQNSYNLGSVHFSDQSGIGNFSQSAQNSKFVNLKGSLLQGNIGFVQQTVELDVGTATINLNDDATGAALAVISQDRIVTLSAGTTSDLTTITGAQRPGQRVTLYNIFANTITIKNDAGATVNTIVTPGATDFSLSGHGLVTLMFDVSLAQWRIEGNLGSGGGGAGNVISQGDSNVTVTDAGSGIITQTVDGTQRYSIQANRADYANIPIFGLTDLTFNDTVTDPMVVVGAADTVFFDIAMVDSGDGLRIAFAGDNTAIFSNLNLQLLSATPNTLSAALRLFRDDPSPAISDALGSIHFDGRDSGGGFTNYATLIGGIEVDTAGSEEGSLVLNLITASGTKQTLEMLPDIFGVNTSSIRLDEITLPSNPDTDKGLIYLRDVAGTTTPFFLDSSGTETSMIAAGGTSNVISQGDSNVTVTDVGSGIVTTTVDGTQRYSIQANRADFADLPVFGFTQINFQDTVDAVVGTVLTQNQTDFTMNFPDNADTYNIDFNSIVGLSVDLLRTRFHSNTPNTVSSAISLFRDDPSPSAADALGDINFDGRDSAANFTTYADIIGGIESPTSTAEIGRLTFRLQDSGIMQQKVRMTLDELELSDISILLDEISLPSNPATNQGLIYLRDVAGTTTPFFLDSSGTETSLIGAGSGANTALSNLSSVAINTSLLPAGDGTINLGSASFSWLDTFTERLRIETGGVSTSTANQIISDAGGMVFNTPAGDRYEFNISGSPNGIAIEEDRIQFLTTGRQHRIDVTGASIQIQAENATDEIEFFTGTSRSNATVIIEDERTTWRSTTTDTQPILFQMIQNNNTPADFRTIANIDMIAEDSGSNDTIYARVSASSNDITDGTEDGLLQLGVVSGGTLIASIDMEGDSAGGSLIGFFGVTPVARQSPAATSAAIITALENLGLFV